jgi:hypothetical protein
MVAKRRRRASFALTGCSVVSVRAFPVNFRRPALGTLALVIGLVNGRTLLLQFETVFCLPNKKRTARLSARRTDALTAFTLAPRAILIFSISDFSSSVLSGAESSLRSSPRSLVHSLEIDVLVLVDAGDIHAIVQDDDLDLLLPVDLKQG